jgi:hypothetical protein
MFCKYCGRQIKESSKYCVYCGKEIKSSRHKKLKIKRTFKRTLKTFLICFLILIIIIFIVGVLLVIEAENKKEFSADQVGQNEIISSVVNIYCESIISEEDSRGGSGTIITDSGIILTNSHIIPQDKEYLNIYEEGCLVILPDSSTGHPDEWFWAKPIVIPGISDYYDLAFMEIYDAYYDEEENSYWGTYPRTFPVYEGPDRCQDEYIQLGESIRIYGYPELVGDGYSLTITDGVVSNFLGEGLIATSAKISSGNSGGLAVNQNGCVIGIPSMLISDEYESFGVIISTDLIAEFAELYLDEITDFY